VLDHYRNNIYKVIDVTFSDKYYPLSFNERTLKTLFDKFQTEKIEDLPLQDVLPKERSATQLQLTLKDMFARCLQVSTIVAADKQIDLFNDLILSGTNDTSGKGFLMYFKFYRIYLQSYLEEYLPTVPATIGRFNMIFKEFLTQCPPSKKITTPQELQAYLQETGKAVALAVRKRCKFVVKSTFEEDGKLKKTTLLNMIYNSFVEYKKLILLNEKVSLGEQLDKGDDSIQKFSSFDN
jgi:hypothetical protein